jgi:hypothetical protein
MLGTDGIEPLEVFKKGLPENQPVRPPRKVRSSLRIWKDDHDAIASLLNRFEGKTQADRVSSWLMWSIANFGAFPALDRSDGGDSIASDDLRTTEPNDKTETIPVLYLPAGVENKIDTPIDTETTEPPADTTVAEETDGYNGTESDMKTIASVPSPAPTTGLEAKIDRLIDVMLRFVQVQTGGNANDDGKTTARTRGKVAVEKPIAESSSTRSGEPSPAPRKYKTGEADTTINRAIDAIIAHNERDDRLHDEKWAITINALKNYSLNQRAIERIVNERKDEIDEHHRKHQLGNRHNDRHKRKYKISDVIRL